MTKDSNTSAVLECSTFTFRQVRLIVPN